MSSRLLCMENVNKKSKTKQGLLYLLLFVAMTVIYAITSYFAMKYLQNNGEYPTGVDTLCHIYKGDVLYKSILKGNYWPAYDPLWYNGVEMLRYWAPLPVFCLAACQWLAAGNPIGGFVIFVGISCFLASMSWLYVGFRLKRPVLGSFLGLLWFFIPNNLIAMFYEGNLPRTICMIFLPLLLYRITDFYENKRVSDLPAISVLFALISLCHSGYAGMILISLLVYMVVRGIICKEYRTGVHTLIALILGYMLIGIWLVPSLIGGITSTDSSEIMAEFFQDMWLTINPVARLSIGNINFYFGMATLLLALFGMFLTKKKDMPGFITGILILLGTSNTAYIILSKAPGGQYLWMLRFISIGVCMVLFSFLNWKTLRRGWIVLFCALMLLDTIPSLKLIYKEQTGKTPEERMAEYEEWTLLTEAKADTEQRLALVDESVMDAMSAYLLTGFGKQVATSYGAAWQSSVTATNFKQIDRSLEEGNYLYLFDRCLDMGNDTVVARMDLVDNLNEHPATEMDAAAEAVGYELIRENGLYRYYKLKNSGSFGHITKYEGIAIGTGAPTIARFFPMFKEVDTTKIDDLTFEELSQYRVIYIDGFTYNDRAMAEELVKKLADAGVRIIIEADGIPEDRRTQNQSFMGVICNPISFSQGYPLLDTVDGELDTDLFPKGYGSWSTVFVDGLDEVWGVVKDDDYDIPFIGTAYNNNIRVIALNLTYYYSLTRDEGVGKLLSRAIDFDTKMLPQRTLIPLEVYASNDRIEITSNENNVNSTIAFHESFVANNKISSDNNLMIVNKGKTIITMPYPYLLQGAVVSGVAFLLIIVYAAWMSKNSDRKREDG